MDKQLIEILSILMLSAICTYYHGMSEYDYFIIAYFINHLVPVYYGHTRKSLPTNTELPLDRIFSTQDVYSVGMMNVIDNYISNND